MGGFHIALNYLSLLGKKYTNSGLEELLIGSGVYAAGTTSVVMFGKSYNRGIQAPKLSIEALFRLLWQAFLQWLKHLTRQSALTTETSTCRLQPQWQWRMQIFSWGGRGGRQFWFTCPAGFLPSVIWNFWRLRVYELVGNEIFLRHWSTSDWN